MIRSDQPTVLEVPTVDHSPEVKRRSCDTLYFANYLLNVLLRHEAGVLYADGAVDGGRWHVHGWTRTSSGLDEVVAAGEPWMFRSVLDRFGRYYMGGQVYGG